MKKLKNTGKFLSLQHRGMRFKKTCILLFTSYFGVAKKYLLTAKAGVKRLATALSFRHKVLASVAIVGIATATFFFTFKTLEVIGATYTFIQTDWSGGASTTAIATHPGNQTGWIYYQGASSTISFSNTSALTLTSSTYVFTDDATTSTTGGLPVVGGGFGNGINSSTYYTQGANPSANISLATTSVIVVNNWDPALTVVPGTVADGATMLRNGSDNDIYVLRGNFSNSFYKYSISGNSWSTLTAVPTTVADGATMLRNGSDNDIYVLSGNGSTGFYKYSISGNSWSTLTNVPAGVGQDGTMTRNGSDDDIYVLAGNSSVNFYKYSISGNSWTTLTAVPGAVSYGATMLRNGSDNDIYILRGNFTNSFYKYSISGNSWTTLTNVPAGSVYVGGTMIRNGADDGIYVIEGNGGGSFFRYSISGNSWTTLTDVPGAIHDSGSAMSRNGADDSIYVLQGNLATGFYKYSISGNSWVTYPAVPGAVGLGGTILRDGADDSIYVLQGNSATGFYRFIINKTPFATSGIFTSAVINLNAKKITSLSWASSTPVAAGVNALQLQIATSSDSVTWSSFTGPSGGGTFFNAPSNLSGALTQGTKYLKYKAFFQTATTTVTPILSSVAISYDQYSTAGAIVSSPFNTTDSGVIFANLSWVSSTPQGATLQFQIATSSNGVAWSSFVGPNGLTSSFFQNPGAAYSGANGKYFQYKVFFTSDGLVAPVLNSVSAIYVSNAAPTVRVTNVAQNNDGTVTIIYEVKDVDADTDTNSIDRVTPSFQYCPGGTNCSVISALTPGATSSQVIVEAVTSTFSVTWRPASNLDSFTNNIYDTQASIKMTVDDLQGANRYGYATSSVFTLDTTPPASITVRVDASTTPATMYLSATDTSAVQYKLSLSSNLSGAIFADLISTTTIALSGNPSTIYAQFKDDFANTTSILSATTPETPTSTVIQDVSNVNTLPAEYRLFLAWRIVTAPTPGFGSYKVWRSTNQTQWSLVGTVIDRNVNYFMDAAVASGTLYYYKITTIDSVGNGSYASNIINGRADGIQNAGEGGGGAALAPVISNVATSTITPTQVTITWDTDVLSGSMIGYSTSPGVFTSAVTVSTLVNNASGVGNHSVVLSNLVPNTTYYFRVGSTNITNATAYDTNGGNGFVVKTIIGPIITSAPSTASIYNNGATINWGTDSVANSTVFVSTSTTFAAAITTSTANLSTSHSVVLAGLTANTRYYYYVRSADGSGNTEYDKNVVAGVAQYYNFVTTNNNVAPTFSSFTVTPASSSVSIAWSTDQLSDSQVDFGLTSGYGSVSSYDSLPTNRHIISFSGLTPTTLYHFRTRSRNADGILGLSNDQTFITLSIPDTILPVITNVATSSAALDRVTVTWQTDKNTNATVDYGTTLGYGSLAGNLYDFSTNIHSVTITGLTGATTYYFRVNSIDTSGNVASLGGYTFTTVADNTAPIISGVHKVVNQTAAIITWTTNEQANSRVDYGLTTSYASTTSILGSYDSNHSIILSNLTPNTTYYFRVRSADPSGNLTTDDNSGGGYSFITIAIPDTNLPIISNVASSNISLNRATITWNTDKLTNATVDYGTTAQYGSLAGVIYDFSSNSHTVTLTNLAGNTQYYFRVNSMDAVGNLASSTGYSFTTVADVTAPIISNVTHIVNQRAAFVNWNTSEPADGEVDYGTSLSFASSSVATTTFDLNHSIILNDLEPNTTYYYRIITKDPSGNSMTNDNGGGGFTFTTLAVPDISLPIISGVATQNISLNRAEVVWLTDKLTNATVDYGTTAQFGTLAGLIYDFSSSSHRVVLNNLSGGTQYFYRVNSMDAVGNIASSTGYSFTTAADNVVPVISAISSVVNQTVAFINWTTNEPATGQVDFSLDTGFAQSVVVTTTYNTNHSILLSNLTPNTRYYYRVKSTDPSGNLAISDNGGNGFSFVTVAVPDITLPIISNVATSSISLSQATVTWDTDKNTNATVDYGTTPQFGSIAGSLYNFFNNNHSVNLTSLTGNTLYYFRVNSMDVAGNIASSSGHTFTTVADVTPPVISNITQIVNQRTAFINWATNEQANTQVNYGLDTGYASTSAATTTFDASHSMPLFNLIPNTRYYYRVKSADPSGNVTTDDNGGAGYQFVTQAIPDTAIPVISNLATSSVALTQATISWTTDKLTNGTVDFGPSLSYGSLAGSLYNFNSSTHSITLSGLTGNTQYFFRANSADSVGNSVSSTGSFVTLPDVTPPVISATTALANDTAAFINWHTDELAVAEVKYGLSAGNLDTSVAVTSTFNTNHSLPLTGLTTETTYYYSITSADPSANTSTVGPLNFTTLKAGQQAQASSGSGSYYPAIDKTAPTLYNFTISEVTAFGAQVTWTTDEDASSIIRYGLSTDYGALSGDELTRSPSHKVVLVSLRPATTYHFRAVSFDASGNVGLSDDKTFTTLNVDGTTAAPTAETAQNNLLEQVSSASQELIAQILQMLIANPYLKNVSQKTLEKVLTEMTSKVIDAPTIVGTKPVVEVAGTSATIRWSTDKLSTSAVAYAKDDQYKKVEGNPYSSLAVNIDEMATAHKVELTGLTPGTLYHFQVLSKGTIGPEGRSDDFTFRTTADLPIISDVIIAKATESSVVLHWVTNIPTITNVEYKNNKTGKVFTESDFNSQSAHDFEIKNLDSGTEYTLVIKATSAIGAVAESLPVTFSTTIDTRPPYLLNVASNSTLNTGLNSRVQTIISWDTDEPATAQVYYQEGIAITTSTYSSPKDTSLNLRHVVVLTSFKPGTVYKYWIESHDAMGNTTKSESYSILTPVEKKTIFDIIANNFQSVFGWTKNLSF